MNCARVLPAGGRRPHGARCVWWAINLTTYAKAFGRAGVARSMAPASFDYREAVRA
jgi:hypothetical protein